MEIAPLHSWDVDTAEARALQTSLAARVNVSTPLGPWETIAAADVSYNKYSEWLYAAVIVVRAGTFEVVERVGVVGKATFPYIPGLLSFREAPVVLEAFRKLKTRPDVVLCDGQGTAHPRRLGLACHLGLWLDLPTIGCAKSLLCGKYDEPGPDRGDRSPLVDRGEVVGAVVRTRLRVSPVYVSPGHRCDLESAVAVTLATSIKYRLPVPARLAHEYVNAIRRAADEDRTLPL
ncbi:MAG: deoxyribonuclease V [Paludisphaera borealis]|uniref:deoxyribonuclease V n=1 Tax=Paludisphaera borealis TaxID=1387353 RepID=UPI00284554BD|nr:deoxyribonuclease V [Paludisphaera borealis]MDR3618484.1 deoxyribonuclease V [Paludisphaera borealis]